MIGRRAVQLREVLTQEDRLTATPTDTRICLVGVRWYGRGAYEASVNDPASIKAGKLARVQEGDFVYNRMWVTRGTFAVVPTELADCYVTNEYPIFRAVEGLLDVEYLKLVSETRGFLREVDARAVGSTDRRRLHPRTFLDMTIELPSLDEQAAAVGLAQAVAEVELAARIERDAAGRLLTAAVDQEMAADPANTALPRRLVGLGEVAEVRSGITKGRKTKNPLRAVPFLRAANVQNGVLDLDEIKTIDATEAEVGRFRLAPGDVLMVEGSGNPDRLGRGWLWDGQLQECLHQNHVFRARPDTSEILPRFLAYALTSRSARAYFMGAAKSTSGLHTINRAQVVACPLVLPSLDVQSAIVKRLDAIRTLVAAADQAIDRITGLRTALIGSLLSGDVRPPDVPSMDEAAASG